MSVVYLMAVAFFGLVWFNLHSRLTISIQDLGKQDLWLPTVISRPADKPTNDSRPVDLSSKISRRVDHPAPSLPAIDYTRKEFWRYDEAAPPIQNSKVHFLSSLPDDLRLTLDAEEAKINITNAFVQYASNPNNTFPQKYHLAEINPSIARLPQKYLTNDEWLRAFDPSGNQSHNIPLYVSTYRITIQHNCIIGLQGGEGTFGGENHIKFNFDYGNWRKTKPKNEFIGFALLNSELEIVAEIAVDCISTQIFKRNYEDFRVFNLRGGDGKSEQLYLTSEEAIVPIELVLPDSQSTNEIKGYKKLLPPSMFDPYSSNQEEPKFTVWHRDQTSCSEWKGKNFLYFDEMTAISKENSTSADAHFETKLLYWPSKNPNIVHSVDLNEGCKKWNKNYFDSSTEQIPPQPKASFQTMEGELPNQNKVEKFLFTGDRGSACCIRVPRDQIPISESIADYVKNSTKYSEDNTLLVGLVHMKTQAAAQSQLGVTRNTYLSRFIAFLPHEPYTIVARTGKFCLGFPEEEDSSKSPEYPLFLKERRLWFKTEVLESCPRIHFPMSIIDKHTNDKEQDSVIISYGVQDCYSRFVEVKKSDIVQMFRGNNTSS